MGEPLQSQPRQKKLLEQVRDLLRIMEYAKRTEKTYIHWIRRFILFHDKRHPREMGTPEVKAFLMHLAVNERVSASTQNQALSSVSFLYRYISMCERRGMVKDRDLNAAINLNTVGRAHPEPTDACGHAALS